MSYNPLNKLKKIEAIQTIYKSHKVHEGISDAYIYRSFVKDVFFISKKTFNNYMATNVTLERKKINDAKNKLKNQ